MGETMYQALNEKENFTVLAAEFRAGARQAAGGMGRALRAAGIMASHGVGEAVRSIFTTHSLTFWRETPSKFGKGGK